MDAVRAEGVVSLEGFDEGVDEGVGDGSDDG